MASIVIVLKLPVVILSIIFFFYVTEATSLQNVKVSAGGHLMRKAKSAEKGALQVTAPMKQPAETEAETKVEEKEDEKEAEKLEGKEQKTEKELKETDEALEKEEKEEKREAENKIPEGGEDLVPGGAPPDCDSTLSAIGLACSARTGVGEFNVEEADKSWNLKTSDNRVVLNGTYTTQEEACAVLSEAEKCSNSHKTSYCLKTNSAGEPYFILRNEKKVGIATSIAFSSKSARDNAICTVAFFGFFSKKPCSCTGETDTTQCTGEVKVVAGDDDDDGES